MIKLKEIIKPSVYDKNPNVIYLGKGDGNFWQYKTIWLITMESKSIYYDFVNVDYYRESLDKLGEGSIKYLESFLDNGNVEFDYQEYNDLDYDENSITTTKYFFNGETYRNSDEIISDLIGNLQENNKNYFIIMGEK